MTILLALAGLAAVCVAGVFATYLFVRALTWIGRGAIWFHDKARGWG